MELTAAETSLLRSLPAGSEPLESATWCELEAGHPGLHYGLGQISGQTWWWLRWSDSRERREFVDAGFCGARPEHAQVDCSLPRGHVGHHDFEFAPAQ